jgi:oligopeptide/dipeptide ABC transporter ATP-binding protein
LSNVLEVRDLTVEFPIEDQYYAAVYGVNFHIAEGETLGLVGESGCGKSVTSLALMRLLAPTSRVRGEVRFKGQNLLALPESQMRRVRGNDIGMIFQEPMTSLNPVHRIGTQIAESLILHRGMSKRAAWDEAVRLLQSVGIPRAAEIAYEYPHRLSGGMRQRVMIAIAMACNPSLLIADEPTTALDVTIQAQILDLMRRLTQERGTATLLITHDLGVVAEMCDRVAVMYAGRIVEEGPVREILRNPQHPYTRGLLSSLPKLDGPRERLKPIDGNVPAIHRMPQGCRFAPRCAHAMPVCREQDAEFVEVQAGHRARCWLHAP